MKSELHSAPVYPFTGYCNMFAHVCNWVTPCTALRKHFVSPCNTKTLSPSTLNLHPIMPWDSVVLTSLLHPPITARFAISRPALSRARSVGSYRAQHSSVAHPWNCLCAWPLALDKVLTELCPELRSHTGFQQDLTPWLQAHSSTAIPTTDLTHAHIQRAKGKIRQGGHARRVTLKAAYRKPW